MKKKSARRICSVTALFALVLGCTIMMVPLRAEAAKAAVDTRIVWTATEAEIARQISEGVPLRDIINNGVTSGEKIHDVVAACIKVGVDPSRVVHTAIAEGYAPQTVVKAALKAGAPLKAVVNSATHAGLDKRSTYVGDIVGAAIKAGENPSLVVHTAITEGYPTEIVVRAALQAGAPLEAVVNAASSAGADPKAIYVGAAVAGASPRAVEHALSNAQASGTPVFISIPPTVATTSFPALGPTSAIFGRGGIVLSQAPAWALPALRLGPFRANPFFSVSETFSDNITYAQNDNKSDSITTVTPGLRLQLPFKTHAAELEYYSVFARYGKYSEEDTSDHHVGGSVDFKAGDRLDLRLRGNYDRGHDPRSSTLTGTNEEFDSNVAAASALYRIKDNVTVRLDYGKSAWRFITSDFRDREEDQIAGAVFYRVLPGTSVFIEYDLKNIAYAEDTLSLDSTVGTLQAGLTWDISARSKGTVKAGIARKDFSSSTRSGGTVKVGSADVRHDFSTGTTVVLTAERSMNEPNLPDIAYFITTGAYAELTQRFLKKWAVVLRGAFVQDLYFIRTDRTALSGARIKYQAKDWLELAVDYNLRERNSTIPANKYAEHSSIIMVNVPL